jgi:hypothetical protein
MKMNQSTAETDVDRNNTLLRKSIIIKLNSKQPVCVVYNAWVTREATRVYHNVDVVRVTSVAVKNQQVLHILNVVLVIQHACAVFLYVACPALPRFSSFIS